MRVVTRAAWLIETASCTRGQSLGEACAHNRASARLGRSPSAAAAAMPPRFAKLQLQINEDEPLSREAAHAHEGPDSVPMQVERNIGLVSRLTHAPVRGCAGRPGCRGCAWVSGPMLREETATSFEQRALRIATAREDSSACAWPCRAWHARC